MKPSLLLALLLSFPTLGQAAEVAVDNRSVEAVVEAFRASIVDKDKPRFVKLFLDQNTVWQNVVGEANLRKMREKKPEAVKVRVDPKDNPTAFIDEIVADKERQEEKFRNVKIDSDGEIASVYFDYSYHADDKETNHGKEAWHLVRTDDGWKIVSVIWSVNWTPAED